MCRIVGPRQSPRAPTPFAVARNTVMRVSARAMEKFDGFRSHGVCASDRMPGSIMWLVTKLSFFDFETGECLGAVTRPPCLNGQAVSFFL